MVGPSALQPRKSFRARLISGGLWAIAGKSLSACGSFLVFLIIANSVSNEDTSAFVFCESAAIFGTLLATGGLHSVIVRVLRNWQHVFPGQLIIAFAIRITAIYLGLFLAFAGLALAICYSFDSPGVEQMRRLLLVVFFWTMLLGANQLVSEFLRGFENFRDAATMGGQNPGILTLGVLLPILLACSLSGTMSLGIVLGSQIIAMAITFVFGLIRIRKTFRTHSRSDAAAASPSDNTLGFGDILSEGIPNLITQITTLGVTQSEILILGQMATPSEIAAYAGIKRLVQITGAPLLMINSALPTFIADLVYQKNLNRLEAILRGSATLCFLPLLAVSIVFIAFPGWTIDLFFHADYSVGAESLQLLSIGNIAAVGTGSCGLLLMMSGHQRFSMLSGTIGAIVFVLLAPWLTSVFGITGMALGVASSTIIRNVVTAAFAKKCVGIWSTPTFSGSLLRESVRIVRHKNE